MNISHRLAASLLIASSVWAAEFQTGQAARAVIGQSSFSSRETGVTPMALSLANGRLYAADASRRLLTFDLSQIPGPKDDVNARPGARCPLCGFSPLASIAQSVIPGVAAVAVNGKTVAIADASSRRVLIWRDSSSPRATKGPDVVIGRGNPDVFSEPISVAFDGRRLFVGDGALHRVLVWNGIPLSDNQPADAVLGQQGDIPGAETISRPAALVSDGTNLFVGDSTDHRILVFTASDRPLANNAVMNSASLSSGPLAPGTLISVTGRDLSDVEETASDDGSQDLPNNLAGVEVFLNGLKLPLLSVSPSELRAQIPYDVPNPSAMSLYVRTEFGDGVVAITNAVPVRLLTAAPGLFAFGGAEPRPGMVLHANGSSGQPSTPVTADNPAKPGEALVLWAAGLGTVDKEDAADAPVISRITASAGGRPVEVVSATLPQGATGIYEVRIQLPADLPASEKTQLLISQNGLASNAVTIPVESAVH
jgi:uncharacterized protein (TIGR03437 family)